MKCEIQVPDGVSGEYRVETFVVSEDESRFSGLRPREFVAPGTYKRLMRDRTVVMSNTPMEINTNWEFMAKAHGKVLINGLGLGMVLTAILRGAAVKSVRVIEISPDVIALVGPTFASDPRVEIIQADALVYKPAKGEKFDCVYHDIWDFITSDNLPDMHKLHRTYANRTAWQRSWQRGYCEYQKLQDKKIRY